MNIKIWQALNVNDKRVLMESLHSAGLITDRNLALVPFISDQKLLDLFCHQGWGRYIERQVRFGAAPISQGDYYFKLIIKCLDAGLAELVEQRKGAKL